MACKKKFKNDPDLYQASAEYKRLRQLQNENSHRIGEIAGDSITKSKIFKESEPESMLGGMGRTSRSGEFDEVYNVNKGQHVVPTEFKGGTADMGYATLKDKDGIVKRFQHGTIEHTKYTVDAMNARGGKAKEAAEAIERIGFENITYPMIKTRIQDYEILEIIVKFFDLT